MEVGDCFICAPRPKNAGYEDVDCVRWFFGLFSFPWFWRRLHADVCRMVLIVQFQEDLLRVQL